MRDGNGPDARSDGDSVAGPTVSRRDDGDGPFPPHPFGTPSFFAPNFVVSPQRWTRTAVRATPRRRRKSDRRREPREKINSLLELSQVSSVFVDCLRGAASNLRPETDLNGLSSRRRATCGSLCLMGPRDLRARRHSA